MTHNCVKDWTSQKSVESANSADPCDASMRLRSRLILLSEACQPKIIRRVAGFKWITTINVKSHTVRFWCETSLSSDPPFGHFEPRSKKSAFRRQLAGHC